jgi:hypothetical protein
MKPNAEAGCIAVARQRMRQREELGEYTDPKEILFSLRCEGRMQWEKRSETCHMGVVRRNEWRFCHNRTRVTASIGKTALDAGHTHH